MDKRIRDELDTLKDLIIETIPVGKIFLFGSHAGGYYCGQRKKIQ